jgi:hypothetical protein
MLKDGLYNLRYRAEGSGRDRGAEGGAGLAILREGRVLGSDPWGGLFVGSCAFDSETRRNLLRLRLEVPPDGELITGFSAGPAGAVLDIVGAVASTPPATTTVVEVAGAPVSVELTYLGPLPLARRRAGMP